MTTGLEDLLQQYGVLSVTLSTLGGERKGSEYSSLGGYYQSLGCPLPDEHVLHVRVSKDNEIHFLKEGEHDVVIEDKDGKKTGIVTVWELPEDEFWFFRAFRPAMFDLENRLPSFLYEMGIVHAYAMFEAYLADILRQRFRAYPKLMGGQRQLSYERIFAATSKEAIIDDMIEREIRDVIYLPIVAVLDKMRSRLGLRTLTTEYDEQINFISLLRNCLLHNGGIADTKLARCKPAIQEGARALLTDHDVSYAINALRKFAYQVDLVFEQGLKDQDSFEAGGPR
jgi:hypothetical protein